MKKAVLREIYFHNADDRNLEEFTNRFLSSGLLWIYIALNPKKQWKSVLKNLARKNKPLFINEYNKAFFFTSTYKELTKLLLGKRIALKNLFLSRSAEATPEAFIKSNRGDDLRWKEVLELIS